jgi:hypothetical protein
MASGTAEDGGRRCWSLGSGEPGVRPGKREGGEATGGPSGSTSSVGWRLRDRRVELRVATHGSGGGSARTPCARGEGGRLMKANKGGGAALRAKTMVAVWGATRQCTTTTWGGYDRDANGRRRQGRRAWPRDVRRVAQEEWGKKAVRRKGSHGAQTGGPRSASACKPSAAAAQAGARRQRRA